MTMTAPRNAPTPSETHFEFTCTQCGALVPVDRLGQVRACPKCQHKLSRVNQLDQLLARWYEPRRWRADLVKPSVPYLVERLWTANGQGERLYLGVSPKYTNYDIFRNMVTRLMIRGIDEGWAELTFPDDPLAEDPQYVLTIVDSEKFADGVEKLFPEVNWDEPVSAAVIEAVGAPAAAPKAGKAKARKKTKKR
jgi:DNA-directed RNA polymerase subunit RPC12/RpoP